MLMQVLTTSGCQHCDDFLKLWNAESTSWKHIELREIDILTEEGQRLVSKYHIFALPGIIIGDRVVARGEVDVEKFHDFLRALDR
jgi:glutaredoxin